MTVPTMALSVAYLLPFVAGAGPTVQLYSDTANVPAGNSSALSWPPAPPYSHTVKDLGAVTTSDACRAKCIAYVNPPSDLLWWGWASRSTASVTMLTPMVKMVVMANVGHARTANGEERGV